MRIPQLGACTLAGLLAAVSMAHGAATAPACTGQVFAVTHFELATAYGDVAPAGPSVGDTRSFHGPVYRPGSRTAVRGSITGVGVTAVINQPVPGQELRAVSIGFQLPDLRNQISVGGYAAYPMTSATLARNTVTVRPITGGTGRFAGARGWLRTTHFARGYWRQEFHLCRTAR